MTLFDLPGDRLLNRLQGTVTGTVGDEFCRLAYAAVGTVWDMIPHERRLFFRDRLFPILPGKKPEVWLTSEPRKHFFCVSSQGQRLRRYHVKSFPYGHIPVADRLHKCMCDIICMYVMQGFHSEVGKVQRFTRCES